MLSCRGTVQPGPPMQPGLPMQPFLAMKSLIAITPCIPFQPFKPFNKSHKCESPRHYRQSTVYKRPVLKSCGPLPYVGPLRSRCRSEPTNPRKQGPSGRCYSRIFSRKGDARKAFVSVKHALSPTCILNMHMSVKHWAMLAKALFVDCIEDS